MGEGETVVNSVATEPVALMFPGQGSQSPGMGKLVYEHSEAARRIYEEASDITGLDIADICFRGEDDQLTETTLTQPAVLTTSVAIAAAMSERFSEIGRNIRPRLFGGHSLGLFSAGVAAEALDFRAALMLIVERARLMSTFYHERPVGMASVIGLDTGLVEQICEEATLSPDDRVDVANHNLDTQSVISGDISAIGRALDRARHLRAKVIPLKVKVSSHTPLHAEQSEQFAAILRDVQIDDPSQPIVSNISSVPLMTADALRSEFEAQLHSPVYWADNVREMIRHGIDTFVEAGPGHVLARLVRRISDGVTAVSLADATEQPIPISVLPARIVSAPETAR